MNCDISEHERTEGSLAQLNRTLQTLYQCNQVLVHATAEDELLQSICRILVEVGGVRMAWVGYRERNAQKTVRPVAQAGYEEGYLGRVDVTWADTEMGQGPAGTAIRTCTACWISNTQTDARFAPWRAEALQRGYASVIALPLMADGEAFGALILYAEEPNRFNDRTLEQFTELANNLAYGVIALRTRDDRRRAEEALQESERRFRAIVENAQIGIDIFDEGGNILLTNRALQQMLGCSAEELTRREQFDALTHPDDHARDRIPYAALLAGKRQHYETETRYILRDGRLVYANRKLSVLRDAEGKSQYVLALVEDITERKRAEEALRQTRVELARVSRVMTMGELTASIAHEVNQPLAAIVTNGNACLRWLGRQMPDLDEARAAVERIIRDAHRASEVIQQIRALGKKTDPQKAWLDLNEIIHEVIALVDGEARRQKVSLRLQLSAALPLVLGDRIQLQQVILNLMMNGIEAMLPINDRPRELRVRSRRHDANAVLVAVQDTGVGLDPQTMARLFDAFFTTKPGGMGMGLSISRTIIRAHHGRLWATPNEGHGATFQFTLPMSGGV